MATGDRGQHPAPSSRAGEVLERLQDARGRRVVFIAHCLLNENVRYLGGATRPGAVIEAIEPYLRTGVGIVQMPCPEQHAWGGVLKRHLIRLYGNRSLRWAPMRRLAVTLVRTITALRYASLARRTARAIADYTTSNIEVVELVGVGASPSCGVTTTLDLDGALRVMARCQRCALVPLIVNEQVVAANVIDGPGLFISAMRRRLAHDGLDVPMREHDLLDELDQAMNVAPGRVPLAGGAVGPNVPSGLSISL